MGAQTVILAKKSPQARIISMDISQGSIDQARQLLREEGLFNVQFQRADIFQLPFQEDSFDHIFLCFVLEHLSDPLLAMQELKKILDIPEYLKIAYAIRLGYPISKSSQSPRVRRDIAGFAHHNRFGNRVLEEL